MFVPRSVGKKKASSSQSQPSGSILSRPPNNESLTEETEENEEQGAPSNAVETEKQLATMLNLALSNYSIWENNELRRLLETREGGWISLALLMKHSPWFAECTSSENEIIRAYRIYGNESLEVQMIIKKRSFEFTDTNLYNIRRKDWDSLSELGLRHKETEFWDDHTVYIENIPPSYRQPFHTLIGFVQTVMALPDKPFGIQSVHFPPREGSTQNDHKCRGFAFVVCGSAEQQSQAIQLWSWDGIAKRFHDQSLESETTNPADGEMRKQAMKCGLRALSKSKWNQLKEEYLRYERQILLSNAASARTGSSSLASGSKERGTVHRPVATEMPDHPTETLSTPPTPDDVFDLIPDYPTGCLAFVRNLHPRTNKAAIKAFLSIAFTQEGDGKEVDYVDFNKGMDSCHIRLSMPNHTNRLHEYFTEHRLVQANGFDQRGRSPSHPNEKPIEVVIVSGKLEWLYWERVPTNIRQTAMVKAAGTRNTTEYQHEDKKREGRKRQRKV